MKKFFQIIVVITHSYVSQAQTISSTSLFHNDHPFDSTKSISFLSSAQSQHSPQTRLSLSEKQFVSSSNDRGESYNATELFSPSWRTPQWLSEGAIGIEFNVLGAISGQQLLDKALADVDKSEDQFLASLNLAVVETDPGNGTQKTTPLSNYTYGGSPFIAIRAIYYFNDRFGLGIHLSHYNYDQTLPTIGLSASLVNFTDYGISTDYYLYHNNELGVAATADIGFPQGSCNIASALYECRNNSNVEISSTGNSLIVAAHKSVKLSSVQAIVGARFDYLIYSFLGIKAGLHLYYLNASLESPLWTSSQKSFTESSLALSFGVNFYLWNK